MPDFFYIVGKPWMGTGKTSSLAVPSLYIGFMHSFKYGGYCPHTPFEMLTGAIFAFLGVRFLRRTRKSILIATIDMRK